MGPCCATNGKCCGEAGALLLRNLEGSHSLRELPEAAVPSEMGSGGGGVLSFHPLGPHPPKEKVSWHFFARRVIPTLLGFFVPSAALVLKL